MSESKRLLILSAVWPEPASSAAGRRMMRLIELFDEQGWNLTYGSTAGQSEYAVDLEARGVDTRSVTINSSAFDVCLRSLQPQAVLFDRFTVEEQFGWRVQEQCPRAVRILDTEDLHCLRRSRGRAVEEGRAWTPDRLIESDTAKREIASILRCDLSLIISEYELQLLRERFGVDESLLHYLPFRVPEAAPEPGPPFGARSDFVTIGNFRHRPNMDAVHYLRHQIWPHIHRRLPDARMQVYGAYAGARAQALHEPGAHFYIHGRVNDAGAAVRNSRICLAPLRFGAGLKGKLVEAMQCGTPSVTTPIGAEGLGDKDSWPGAVETDPATFAAKAAALYTDVTRWNEARRSGAALINKRLATPVYEQAFTDRLGKLRANLRDHRLGNFTGAMLMHHSTASTRYMSKWIEAKNKNAEDNSDAE